VFTLYIYIHIYIYVLTSVIFGYIYIYKVLGKLCYCTPRDKLFLEVIMATRLLPN